MATVAFGFVWLNDGADLSQRVVLRNAGALTLKPAIPGAVQALAGDRRRLALTGPVSVDWDLSSPYVEASTALWLRDRIGKPVWVRDWLGNRVYGSYLSVSMPLRLDGSGRYDVSLTIAELTEPA